MKDTIVGIFSDIQANILEPLGEGLWGISPGIIWVAAVIAVLVLLFSSFSGRAKVGGIVTVILIAVLFPYIPSLIDGALGGTVSETVSQSAQAAAGADAPAPDTLGELDA